MLYMFFVNLYMYDPTLSVLFCVNKYIIIIKNQQNKPKIHKNIYEISFSGVVIIDVDT